MADYLSSDENSCYDYDDREDDSCYLDDDENFDGNDDGDDDDFSGCLGALDIAVDGEAMAVKRSTIKVITKESLLAAQSEDLHRVMDLLSLKEHQARTLLIHNRWDLDKVLSVLVEHGKDKLCAEAGVPVLEHNDFSTSDSSSTVECKICFEKISADNSTTMECGHCFCNDCWTEHFIVKINEGQSRQIRCMEYKCSAICDEAKVRLLVCSRDPDLAEKFDRFLLESYIEDNKRVKWCPSVPHCGNAIRAEEDEICEVECACGLQFCFNCSSEAHSPCSCQMWDLWSKKCQDESETANWLTVHTKPCPKCGKPVEKNGGCNLVVCVCQQAFCWICGAATGRDHTWTSITDHSCGRFKDEHVKKLDLAKRNLARYNHYHSRYQAHADSLKLEANKKENLEGRIHVMQERDTTSKDFSWIMNGHSKLFRYRRVLSHSYVFAFYMFSDDLFKKEMTEKERVIKQNLFEDLQQQFEAKIERLSMALMDKFDEFKEKELPDCRLKIIALSKTTDTLCRNLYEYIETDLLGSLKLSVHRIAPYRSKGAEKAASLLSHMGL